VKTRAIFGFSRFESKPCRKADCTRPRWPAEGPVGQQGRRARRHERRRRRRVTAPSSSQRAWHPPPQQCLQLATAPDSKRVSGRSRRRLFPIPAWLPRLKTSADDLACSQLGYASDWDRTWPENPIQSCVVTLRDAVETSDALSGALRSWGPEQEKRETPGFWEVS
jgi:hypothetical protein